MLLLGNIQISVAGELKEFAFHHLPGGGNQDIENFQLPLAERHAEGCHIEPIAHQDGDLISPLCIHRCAATTDAGVVDDIVMHQRCRVNHLNDRTQSRPDRSVVSAHLGAQQQDGGTDPFAAAVADIPAYFIN